MPTPRNLRKKQTARALIEALEPRQLLSSTLFVQGDSSPVLLCTFAGKNVTIAEDATSNGPTEQATVNWGDGTSSAATLQRLANGKVQVWGGHAYAAVKSYQIEVFTSLNASKPKEAYATTAQVMLNATRGRTVNAIVGPGYSGVVGTVDRAKGLPVINTPQTSLALPAGTQFAQYTVGDGGATATFRIDWGDGTVTDGSLQSNARGNYNVVGSHTFTSAGAFRVITNILIESSDGTLLHVDMLDSSAHIKFLTNGNRQFGVPAHVQLSWSQILPPSTSVPVSSDAGDSSGGTGGVSGSGTLVVNVPVSGGSGEVLNGGVLTFSGGSDTSIRANGSDVTSTGILTFGGSGATGSLTLIGGTGGLHGSTGTSNSGTLIINTSGTGISTQPSFGPAPSGGSIYSFPGVFLSGTNPMLPIILNNTSNANGPSLSINGTIAIHADDTVTLSGGLTTTTVVQASQVLPLLQSGSISFDADDSVAQINADLQFVRTSLTGTITLGVPASSVNIPSFTNATIVAPPDDSVSG